MDMNVQNVSGASYNATANQKPPVEREVKVKQEKSPPQEAKPTAIEIRQSKASQQDDMSLEEMKEALESALANADKAGNPVHKSIRMRVFEKNQRVYAEIVDRNTGEVIGEVPSREVIEKLYNIAEAAGLLFDRDA